MIPAATTQVVPVYCVEHGRWTEEGGTREFRSGKALAHGRLRGQASYAAQDAVWAEVAQKNQLRKTENATDTYRTVATQQSDGTLDKSATAVQAAIAKLPAADRDRMIGYVVSLNGKVATVDMFTSPALFHKLETKLVRSYLTEAVDIVAQKGIKAPTAADVKTFMADAEKAKEERSYDTASAETRVQKGTRANKAKVEYKPAKGQPAPASSPVYENYQEH
jgi:hypothetical protein